MELLTQQEIREITGYTHTVKQVEWLRSRGWPHEVSGVGYPIVLRSVALSKLGAPSTTWNLDPNLVT